ncbi:hypothetical protein MKX03_000070 [Papaver bracteatum]|nr:hypothetical protein MKX03_000070 [Papaver bracteatum]
MVFFLTTPQRLKLFLKQEQSHPVIFSSQYGIIEVAELSTNGLSKVVEQFASVGLSKVANCMTNWTNPNGVIQMGLAENQGKCFFQDYHGLLTFRKAMASFMESVREGRVKFDPERVVLTAGATAANELITFVLADPGDACLFQLHTIQDLRWRTGVEIVPVHCDTTSMNIRVRGLLLTNPSNPLGTSMQRSVLEEILNFAAQKNIHLVMDEIYSGSVFSSSEFISISEILEAQNYKDAERVHIVYSLSKDLGIPGFRIGTIYSYNDHVVTTARRMSSFSLISSHTQHLFASMLLDTEFTKIYIQTNRERLRKRK